MSEAAQSTEVAVPETSDGKDVIVQTAHAMENLTKDTAYALAHQLSENVEYTFFQLGGVFSVIQSNGWFHDEGYETFRDFVEAEYGVQYRKAVYLISIYNGLVESGVDWNKVKHLGWTKLKELSNVLTPSNVDDWLKKIEGMTVLQIQELLRQGKGDSDTTETEQDVVKISTVTFKVHEDQKEVIREAIEKAKLESHTEYDAVALENICMAYLGSGPEPVAVDLAAELKSRGAMGALELFDAAFPDVELTVNKDSLPKD